MAADEIHVNDVGTVFKVTIADCPDSLDVSSATTKTLKFKKPSGEVLSKAGVFFTDGTDGIIKYTSVSGDLDECGRWELQAFLVLGVSSYHSDVAKFRVFRNLGS